MSYDIYVTTSDGVKPLEQASPLIRVNMWQYPQGPTWGGWQYYTLAGFTAGDLLMVDWGGWPGEWRINGSLPNIMVRGTSGDWGYIRFTAYRRIA